MKVTIDGLDQAVAQLSETLDGVEGENVVPVDDLFTDRFMRRFTDVGSFDEFLANSPWDVDTQAEFEAIPRDELDDYVAETTEFEDWPSMKRQAVEKWIARLIGF